jgi:hypothetical protein
MVPKTCHQMLSRQYRFVSVHFNKLKPFFSSLAARIEVVVASFMQRTAE